MLYNVDMEFSEWFNKKYNDWRGNRIGNEVSVSQYARMLGIKQQVVDRWLKGINKPESKEHIDALLNHYGKELLDVLHDLPADIFDPPLNQLPPDMRRRLLLVQAEAVAAFLARGLNPEDPEAEQLTIEILAKHGFKYIATETE